jgi:hypothetical protein
MIKQTKARLSEKQNAFINNKMGADLSMNVIIIAAVGLLVLVILAVLIFGAGSDVNEGTGCANFPGAQCSTSDLSGEGYFRNRAFDDSCSGDLNYCWQSIDSN